MLSKLIIEMMQSVRTCAAGYLQRTHGGGGGDDVSENNEGLLLHTPGLLGDHVENRTKLQ
jgi:hypothetical protein